MHKVIASGSKGNAVLYHGGILVDCGVPFALLEPYLFDIQIILLTHIHGDHFNLSTINKLMANRPMLRIGCGPWMVEHLEGIRNVDVIVPGQVYDYGLFSISSFTLYHDVPNCGYRIYKDETRIFHATDSGHLEGITATGYDLYCVESNYNEETIDAEIAAIEARGEFAYKKGVMNSHLSEQQADDFIYRNRAEHSEIVRLHE